MTAVTESASVAGSQSVFCRPSAPAAPPLRVAHRPTKKRSLAVTMLAAMCALAVILTLAGPASASTAPDSETAVAAQTDLSDIGVGLEAPVTPMFVGGNSLHSYDGSLGCCVAPRTGGIAGTAARNADELLTNGRQVRGNFPKSASPNEVLYRAGPDGSVTYYQVYDELGRPVMRVDLVGRAHGGIPTPHVQEYVLNTNPVTGQTFVNKGPVRAAVPEEIPS